MELRVFLDFNGSFVDVGIIVMQPLCVPVYLFFPHSIFHNLIEISQRNWIFCILHRRTSNEHVGLLTLRLNGLCILMFSIIIRFHHVAFGRSCCCVCDFLPGHAHAQCDPLCQSSVAVANSVAFAAENSIQFEWLQFMLFEFWFGCFSFSFSFLHLARSYAYIAWA